MKGYPCPPIEYASRPYKGVINLNEAFVATIQFYTGKGYTGLFDVTNRFNNQAHMDNYINLMCRKKGWSLDEVWMLHNI